MDQGPAIPTAVVEATASVLHGRIGLIGGPFPTGGGIEGEIETPLSGVAAGGNAGFGLGFYPDRTKLEYRTKLDYIHWSVWLRIEEALGPDRKIGATAGLDHDFLPTLCFDKCLDTLAPSPPGILIGGFFEQTWGPWRMRIAPAVSLVLTRLLPPSVTPWHARPILMGPPWVEVGYQLGPSVEIKFRSAFWAPLGLAYWF